MLPLFQLIHEDMELDTENAANHLQFDDVKTTFTTLYLPNKGPGRIEFFTELILRYPGINSFAP
jgi:hypothetical protein